MPSLLSEQSIEEVRRPTLSSLCSGYHCTFKQTSQVLVSRLSSTAIGVLCAGLCMQHFHPLDDFIEAGPWSGLKEILVGVKRGGKFENVWEVV